MKYENVQQSFSTLTRKALQHSNPILQKLYVPHFIKIAGEGSSFLSLSSKMEQKIASMAYEEEYWRRFTQVCDSQSIVFDVGAQWGLFGLSVAPTAHSVYLFEPDPSNNVVISKNIRRNNFKNVSLYPVALWRENGVLKLQTSGKADGKAPRLKDIVAYRQQDQRKFSTIVNVPTTTLDCLAHQYSLPSVLKIDVEGAEYDVLQGSMGLLSGKYGTPPGDVFLELHRTLLPTGVSPNMVLELLEKCKYRSEFKMERKDELLFHFKKIV